MIVIDILGLQPYVVIIGVDPTNILAKLQSVGLEVCYIPPAQVDTGWW